MDKNDIIEYVMNTPHNTNKAVLSGMLNQLTEGGGSSDFSTAEVTTNIEAGSIWGAFLAMLPTPSIKATFGTNAASNTLVLYKGKGLVSITTPESITTSGAIEQVEGSTYLITGDCTITKS